MQDISQNKIWELSSLKIHNEANEEELNEFKILIRNNENKNIFDRTQNLKNDLKKIKQLNSFSVGESWTSVESQINKKQFNKYLITAKYAAIVLLALITGLLIRDSAWNLFSKEEAFYTQITVPLGQMSEVTLNDGTHVWLNSGTTLKYASDYAESNRNVMLDGEAFFDVTKSDIPFIVQMNNAEVKVLGTSFGALSYYKDHFSVVTLVHGSVEINELEGNPIAELSPNQKIFIPENPENFVIKNVDTQFYNSWVDGKIVFDNKKLVELASRLERWYNVDIQFADEESRELRFSGTILKSKPIDQILKAFKILLPLEIEYKNNIQGKDVIIISKKDCL